jgi:uncharacterized protein YbjT (DUF2867 family)
VDDTKTRSALVLGATGLVGKTCLRLLLDDARYREVRVFARRPLAEEHPKLRVTVGELSRLAEHGDLFTVDDVFCCLGTTIKKAGSQEAFREVDFTYPLEAARLTGRQGGRKFLIVTAIGANRGSKVFYNRVKGEVEEAISKEGVHGVHVFRPSMLLGDRGEFRLGEKLGGGLMRLVSPLMIGKWQKYRPIHADDVARAMVWVAKQEAPGFRIYESDTIQELGRN